MAWKLAVIAMVTVFAVGCDQKSQTEIGNSTKAAGSNIGKAMSTAGDSAIKKFDELKANPGPKLQQEAIKLGEATKKELEKIPKPSPEVQQKLDEIKKRLAELGHPSEEAKPADDSGKATGNNEELNAKQQKLDDLRAALKKQENEVAEAKKRAGQHP